MKKESNVNLEELRNHFEEHEENKITYLNEIYGEKIQRDLPVNITCENDVYTIYADLCGIKKENINLELNGKTLKISALRELCKSDALHDNEISTGNLLRLIRLDSEIDGEKASSSYENGLLIVKLPKNTKNEGLRIKIN